MAKTVKQEKVVGTTIVYDVETGGLKWMLNPITQIAFVVYDPVNMNILEEYKTFIKPYPVLGPSGEGNCEPVYEKAALDYSGVTMEQINAGKDYKVVVKEIIELFQRYTNPRSKKKYPRLAGHNVGFDNDFLDYLFSLADYDLFDYVLKITTDTQDLFTRLTAHTEQEKHTLGAMCEYLGVELEDAHDALNDVRATGECLKKMTLMMRNSGGISIEGSVSEEAKVRFRDSFEF